MGQTDTSAHDLIRTFLEQSDNSGNAFSDAGLVAACIEALGYLRVATNHAFLSIMRQVRVAAMAQVARARVKGGRVGPGLLSPHQSAGWRRARRGRAPCAAAPGGSR